MVNLEVLPNFEQHTLVQNKKLKKESSYDSRLITKDGCGGLKSNCKIEDMNNAQIRFESMRYHHDEDH